MVDFARVMVDFARGQRSFLQNSRRKTTQLCAVILLLRREEKLQTMILEVDLVCVLMHIFMCFLYILWL